MLKKPAIYLKRKIDQFLVGWKSNPRRLPLIIKGARQVGKTECVRHFATGRYKSFIEINFVERPQFKAIVRDGYSVDSIVANITQIDSSIRFVKGSTLLFFDELQEFPEIATALKFFAQEGSYDVILSGSLLGVHYHRVESFSVGYQTSVELRSMDFEEFLWAHGYSEDRLNDVCRRLQSRTALPEAINETYSRLFLDYCILGGMPDVLENYFLTKTFTGSLAIQKQILRDYRADIRKYCEGLDPVRIQNVFDDVPFQLAKENKKFQISKVAPGARHKDYWGCVEWLEQAGVVLICTSLDFPECRLRRIATGRPTSCTWPIRVFWLHSWIRNRRRMSASAVTSEPGRAGSLRILSPRRLSRLGASCRITRRTTRPWRWTSSCGLAMTWFPWR